MSLTVLALSLVSASVALGQSTNVPALPRPQVIIRSAQEDKVTVVQVAPHFATAIRMYEPVNSVVVGDPASFTAEHSEREPEIVFVKPITTEPARTNVVITTTRGHQATVIVVSPGKQAPEQKTSVDVLLRYRPPGGFLVGETAVPSSSIAETASLAMPADTASGAAALPTTGQRGADASQEISSDLDHLLERQTKAPLPELYGPRPDVAAPGKELVRAGVSEVIDHGREVIVLFSAVNAQNHSIELMPPQIQLGGKVRTGWLFKKSRWSTAEQFPIADYRLSRRRLGPGERADGVVVFDRPPFKQSNETLFLQIADTGGVDRPALAPIGFGVSSTNPQKEASHGRRRSQTSAQ